MKALSMRRLGVSVVGIASAVVMLAACSSDTSGKPSVGGSSSSTPSLPSGVPTSLSTGLSELPTSLPTGVPTFNSDNPFCKQIQNGALADIGVTGDAATEAAKKWDALVKVAPDELKSDVEQIATFLHGFDNGGAPDLSKAAELSTAASKIGAWIAANCI